MNSALPVTAIAFLLGSFVYIFYVSIDTIFAAIKAWWPDRGSDEPTMTMMKSLAEFVLAFGAAFMALVSLLSIL